MGLTYHFEFTASADTTPEQLESFLKNIEPEAARLGFRRTMVLRADFDNPERRAFARRITTGYRIENEGLKNVKLKPDSAWEFDQQGGMCRLIPESAVILITVDEQGRETIFGFMRYPEAVQDAHGKVLLATPLGRRPVWDGFKVARDRGSPSAQPNSSVCHYA
jgi:hypothetical protein